MPRDKRRAEAGFTAGGGIVNLTINLRPLTRKVGKYFADITALLGNNIWREPGKDREDDESVANL